MAPETPTAGNHPTGIHATGISVAFSGRQILSEVDCTVRSGSITGILGPSGCGKTTLLRVLAGLTGIDAGAITYDGATRPPAASVAMLVQSPRQACNPRWTLREIITEPARARRRPVPEFAAIVDRVGLSADLVGRHPAQLSDGQLQRACVARALVQGPRYLLCDEPTAMLDPIASRAIVGLIGELIDDGVGAALVTHDHRLAEARCDSILTLQ